MIDAEGPQDAQATNKRFTSDNPYSVAGELSQPQAFPRQKLSWGEWLSVVFATVILGGGFLMFMLLGMLVASIAFPTLVDDLRNNPVAILFAMAIPPVATAFISLAFMRKALQAIRRGGLILRPEENVGKRRGSDTYSGNEGNSERETAERRDAYTR